MEKLMNYDDMFKFLEDSGVGPYRYNPDKSDFTREIIFFVNRQSYVIQWWVNQSYLFIGTGKRPAQIPFKYIYLDTTYPLVGGNRSIGFSNDNGICNFKDFRIPLEIKE